jgi:colanic acid/amylovoran biosynthesis protein
MNSEQKLNILILHAQWNNRGDEAAVRAMIDSLCSKLPIKQMEIMLLPQKFSQFPYNDIETIALYPSGVKAHLDSILTLITMGKLSFMRSGRKFIRSIDEADVIIHAPGGPLIGDLYTNNLSGYSYLYRLIFARIIKNKPVFLYAPSIGPFLNRNMNIIRKFLLKKIDPIILREEISAKYLKEQLGLNSLVTVDSAFQNTIPSTYLNRYNNISQILDLLEQERVIGITITDLKWHPRYKNQEGLYEKINKSFAEFITFLINRDGFILLIPQIFGENSDVPLLKYFKNLNENRICILPENIDSYAQQLIISKLFCTVGMRYHSNIFATKGKVPFISISYEHKMDGFMKKIGLQELLIDINDISANRLITKYIYIEHNYNKIKEQLERKSLQLKLESQKTTEIIIKKLNSNGIGDFDADDLSKSNNYTAKLEWKK